MVPADVDGLGVVRLGGQPVAGARTQKPGPATLAVWATGVGLGPTADSQAVASVRTVVPGPGRWEIVLDGGPTLVAHVSADTAPPNPGDRVGLRLNPDLCTIVPSRS